MHVRCARHISRRLFSTFHKKPLTLPRPKFAPNPDPVDEERLPWYEHNKFYPANPGEVLANQQLLVKIGYGSSSTTWLARDLNDESESELVSTLKINNCDGCGVRELEIEEHIAKSDSSHRGHTLLRTNQGHFEIDGPEGKHLCVLYHPLREPLWRFQRRFEDWVIPYPLLKVYLLILLEGLDCLHSVCNVVHSDLKLENIMMSFEGAEVLNDILNESMEQAAEYKIDNAGRYVFRRNNDFGDLRETWKGMVPYLTDFGSAMQLHGETGRGIYPIHPNQYRPPEVTLGFPWNRSADIWALGTLIWDMAQGTQLFQQAQDSNRHYNAKAHLAEMIALLGPPPPEFIEESHSTLLLPWPEKVRTNVSDGLSGNEMEMFNGPFFDEKGDVLHPHLIPDRKIEDSLPLLEEEDRQELLSFAKKMLTWDPEKRPTARELLDLPFLKLE